METIRNYLEAMFMSLPNTPEVQRAKDELLQMMEDKYSELKAEGKTENEAVGTVISEFGNLDELAESLGISDAMEKTGDLAQSRLVTMEEAREYISAKIKYGFLTGIGVMLCIISPVLFIAEFPDAYALSFLFVAVAAAVGLFVFSGIALDKWKFMESEKCHIEYMTAKYVSNERENFRTVKAALIATGVILCVISFVPLVVLSETGNTAYLENYGAALLFILMGIGVLLFVSAGNRQAAYDNLLSLNNDASVGGHFVPGQKGKRIYINKTVAAIMSVYWQTALCLYASISFLTGAWHLTWIIWIIAPMAAAIIDAIFKKRTA